MATTQSGMTSSLVVGCNIVSNKLKYFLSPIGYLYRYQEKAPHRPRPVTLTVAITICSMPLLIIIFELSVRPSISAMASEWHEYNLLVKSTFLVGLVKFFSIYRLGHQISTIFIILARYVSTANVMATNNNMVSEREQRHFANTSFAVFLFKTIANSSSYAIILVVLRLRSGDNSIYEKFIPTVLLTFINMTLAAPLIYACYLGSVLGKHVENFSMHYVDTMFDQFMKAIEVVGSPNPSQTVGLIETSGQGNANSSDDDLHKKHGLCFSCFCGPFQLIKRVILYIYHHVKLLVRTLNSRKYPELPEMKMTKLSSTSDIRITEAKRIANTHLIRIRLRRTQIMLSELRDMVSDINKMSSPIIMMQILYETAFLIIIATASIQARVYKSLNFLILPTVTHTVGLVVIIVYVCVCLDEVTSQLKLMMNKLFDFIILNHRVKTIKKPEDERTRPPSSRPSPAAASERENEALSETWSQFQYTRKLANTIQFTMGGILPVSRRLVLSILGHILSAVFISIEVMSIIDTSQHNQGVPDTGREQPEANFTLMARTGRTNTSLVYATSFEGMSSLRMDTVY